ncbi:hypothetical protein RBSH_00885 [Rhodopirellula baltica SH28]|uniref:Uncharacterized protein n=1 Tax=Rhodopirellula baltica SH28 TaxID=993517 RepID=K5ED22_RHOBT|nr:hypothetical protein RBSH_00885 [Rhodopirellula baltica SH28]
MSSREIRLSDPERRSCYLGLVESSPIRSASFTTSVAGHLPNQFRPWPSDTAPT